MRHSSDHWCMQATAMLGLVLAIVAGASGAVAAPPGSKPIPSLPSGQQPNILFILVDDQGYDDFGLHNPKYLSTPNMDKFLTNSLRFDNFYVAPQCAQTRAMFLTGRHHARVGAMLTNSGSDYVHPKEVTIAQLMASGGYHTVHMGKWHNAYVQGYAPLDVGFDESVNPQYRAANTNLNTTTGLGAQESQRQGAAQLKGLSVVNNQYVITADTAPSGYAEELNNQVVNWLKQADAGQKPQPFFFYYPLNAIHTPRVYPDKYRQKFFGPNRDPKYNGVISNTLDCWAYTEYLDEVLGTLFDFLDSRSLRKNTVIMLTSDNGPDEHGGDSKQDPHRLPSGMVGHKSNVYEGGIRQTLAVQGPGLPAGVLDSTLLQMPDIFPTVADLGGFSVNNVNHRPLDGISFNNLLTAAGSSSARPEGAFLRRNGSLTTKEQFDRFVYHLEPKCWNADALPALDANRQIQRPQPLLGFDTGGVLTGGFSQCISIRYRTFKWVGYTGTVYRFTNARHIELPTYIVSGDLGVRLTTRFKAAARKWWNSVVADDHSFTRGYFSLGLQPWNVSNVMGDSPLQKNSDTIRVSNLAATGFAKAGDRLCWPLTVYKAGSYSIIILYISQRAATFRLSYGVYADITSGTATSLVVQLPAQTSQLQGYTVGTMALSTSNGANTELCFELISSPGASVFKSLPAIRFIQPADNPAAQQAVYAPINPTGQKLRPRMKSLPGPVSSDSTANATASDAVAQSIILEQSFITEGSAAQHSQQAIPVAKPAPGLNLTGRYKLLTELLPLPQTAAADDGASIIAGMASSGRLRNKGGAVSDDWTRLRKMYGWPDGQGDVMESLWSPYYVEDCGECRSIDI